MIVYCDDKVKWTDQFRTRHEGQFEIRTTNDAREFRRVLESMHAHREVPDIILIDLYHPNYEPGSDRQTTLDEAGQIAIDQLNDAIKVARSTVLKAWDSRGFDVLADARKLVANPDTPIAIYTEQEQGVTLADDGELAKVSELKGEWFLKGKRPFYEDCKLDSLLTPESAQKDKPVILFCDDGSDWSKDFMARHNDRFDIKSAETAVAFRRCLKDMVSENNIPDIILIDLYHPKYDRGTAKQDKLEEDAQAAIEQLVIAIENSKGPILEAWNPSGYNMLEYARSLYEDIPIALYTEQGLTLAEDRDLERVSELNGEWFLKGKNAYYEESKLEKMLQHLKQKKGAIHI